MYPERPDLEVSRHADAQFGVFSAQQARRAGLARASIARRLKAGVWERVHPATYRLRGAPPHWRQSLSAALLWAGSGAVVSHRAAGLLWHLDGMEPDAVEI